MSKTFEYDIFLSYSSRDKEKVHDLAQRLKEDGVRVWLDMWAIQPGDSIPGRIQQGLEQSRALLMCMSQAYFASEWGSLEHHTLLFRDPMNKHRRLIPLLLEDCSRPDIIAHLAYIDWQMPSDERYKEPLAACSEKVPAKIIAMVPREKASLMLLILKGHTAFVRAVAVTPDGRTVVSASRDRTLRIWDLETGRCRATFEGHTAAVRAVAITPDGRTVVSASEDRTLMIWDLETGRCRARYGAKFNYDATSILAVAITPDGQTVVSASFDGTLRVWDLAGQPGYRVIHQLHLNEVAVALVVFDARSETDPLAGVRHWERALRLAQQRQGSSCIPMKKFLVSARTDRGGVSIGEDRLQAVLNEFGFDGYFKTSAKEGWQIEELRVAIKESIPWESLPVVSSSQLFADIKSFLLEMKKTGLLLAPASHLYREFACRHPGIEAKVTSLRDQFEACIGRLENRDLIRRLSFGDYVLLQPELLDAYASAMVNKAKEEPDGLGSMAEEIALSGQFFVPQEQKVTDAGQEQLLLHATVEELVQHDLALRENADDGRYLVFPSQFNRDYEDAPEPKGKALAINFEGPVQSIYATLAVRLGHSGLFTTGRAEMWRNAAIFSARAGGRCGLFLQEFAEAKGRLILFFDKFSSAETRFHFEEFVMAHAKRRTLEGSVELGDFLCAQIAAILCPIAT